MKKILLLMLTFPPYITPSEHEKNLQFPSQETIEKKLIQQGYQTFAEGTALSERLATKKISSKEATFLITTAAHIYNEFSGKVSISERAVQDATRFIINEIGQIETIPSSKL